MINIKETKSERKLREWFVFITILCSALTLSGYASEVRSPRQAATQTELRVSIQNSARKTVSYFSLSKASTVIGFYQGHGEINTDSFLVHYERILKVRFLSNVKFWASCKKGAKVERTPYTRRDYYEFLSNSLRG